MSKKVDITKQEVSKTLADFGLGEDEIIIYLQLVTVGLQTALQISRFSRIARTKVYRILESLVKKGFVKEVISARGKKFAVAPLENFDLVLLQRENDLKMLRKQKPELVSKIESLGIGSTNASQTFYYQAIDGLKQMTYNSLKAKSELCIFEISEGMHPFTGDQFAEEMRMQFFIHKIKTRQLTNSQYIKPFTKVNQYLENCFEIRYVDSKDLKIDFEILIYNDTVATYTYIDEIFGVEIQNAHLAQMQKQLFDFVWNKSRPMITKKAGESFLN